MDLKTFKLFAAGLLVVAGCAKPADFTITGKLTGAVNDTLTLEEIADKNLDQVSVILTDANGEFTYSDTAANPRLFLLRTQQKEYMMLMVLGGEKVNITAEKGKINETMNITGSPQSILIMELNRELIRASTKLDSLGAQYESMKGRGNDAEADTWIQTQFGRMIDEQHTFIRSFIGKHVGDPASLMALSHQIGQQPVLDPAKDFDLFEKVDDQLFKKYPESKLVKKMHNYVTAMRSQMRADQQRPQSPGIGSVAPDIQMIDPQGNLQKLSSLRGKIVLLDFWAGWCGPCRRENPNLVAAYKKYHDKGFEIFQVSLDKTKADWEAAIKQDGLNWIHVSDLKFWSSPVARQYGVESIPANFLLDKDGKIIAGNLRGAALEAELDKVLR